MADDILSKLFADLEKEKSAHEKRFVFQDDIKWPIEISGVKFKRFVPMPFGHQKTGDWVSIRPVGDEKTYIGIYLGDLPNSHLFELDLEDNKIAVSQMGNPAIYVPDLKRIVWGCESWWGVVKDEDDLKKITDNTIQNQWYVKAFRDLGRGQSGAKDAAKP